MTSLVDTRNVHSIRRDIGGILVFIGTVWVVFALDRFLPLERLGLVPRTLHGLTGIVAMPFLHGSFAHLMSNTVPLLLTLLLLAGSRADSVRIVSAVALLGGAGLWLFGRTALHIGASGLVFGLVAFHIFAGIFERRAQSIVIALVVGALYATTLLQGVLPLQRGVSWDGHLFGALAGGVVAFVTAGRLRRETDGRAPGAAGSRAADPATRSDA